MWIKVFYWMRLFTSLAYYVKLIMETIASSLPFMLMVLIILMSFSNFIYVINVNLNHMYPDNSYYKKYSGVGVIDVVISVYMLGMLGDFESEVYITGYDR
jgi:hypothetical protein